MESESERRFYSADYCSVTRTPKRKTCPKGDGRVRGRGIRRRCLLSVSMLEKEMTALMRPTGEVSDVPKGLGPPGVCTFHDISLSGVVVCFSKVLMRNFFLFLSFR